MPMDSPEKYLMKAYRIRIDKPIDPFDEPARDCCILNHSLATIQERILTACNVELVVEPPTDEPYLLISDRVWFTTDLLRQVLKQSSGRLQSTDVLWNDHMASVLPEEDGFLDMAILPSGAPPSFANTAPMHIDWNLHDGRQLSVHPLMQHALRPIRVGARMACHLNHWCDVLRINQLALVEKGETVRERWETGNLITKIVMVLAFLWKTRSLRQQTILRRIGRIGKGCKIHPTAIIEACEIGDGVEIGPYAILRASVIGDNAKIEEFSTVNLSSIGAGAKVGRYSMINLSVLMENAMVSYGEGFQASLFGKGAFVAIGAVFLDLSFGRPVQVLSDGEWIDSGQHFLGCCIGHHAAIGNGVRLKYGVSVPNHALLVAPDTGLVKDAAKATAGVPYRAEGRGVVPIKERRCESEQEE